MSIEPHLLSSASHLMPLGTNWPRQAQAEFESSERSSLWLRAALARLKALIKPCQGGTNGHRIGLALRALIRRKETHARTRTLGRGQEPKGRPHASDCRVNPQSTSDNSNKIISFACSSSKHENDSVFLRHKQIRSLSQARPSSFLARASGALGFLRLRLLIRRNSPWAGMRASETTAHAN